jgi:hypothetical protein
MCGSLVICGKVSVLSVQDEWVSVDYVWLTGHLWKSECTVCAGWVSECGPCVAHWSCVEKRVYRLCRVSDRCVINNRNCIVLTQRKYWTLLVLWLRFVRFARTRLFYFVQEGKIIILLNPVTFIITGYLDSIHRREFYGIQHIIHIMYLLHHIKIETGPVSEMLFSNISNSGRSTQSKVIFFFFYLNPVLFASCTELNLAFIL